MKHLLLLAILALPAFLMLPAFADNPNRGDSGIHGPDYDEILSDMATLQNNNPDIVQFVDYGKSVRGKTLRLIVIRKPSLIFERPAIIISGSTHGDEYLNIVDRLPEHFISLAQTRSAVSTFLNAGGMFIIIPILNPDGYESRRRSNANGKDLNRDWSIEPANFTGFTQVETQSLSDYLKQLNQRFRVKYELTMDYHCCGPALLYPWAYTRTPIPADDLAKHKHIGDLAKENFNIEVGITPDIFGYAPMGTTKDYYYSEYGALAFTYEGKYGNEDEYFDKHVNWFESILEWWLSEAEVSVDFLNSQMLPTSFLPILPRTYKATN